MLDARHPPDQGEWVANIAGFRLLLPCEHDEFQAGGGALFFASTSCVSTTQPAAKQSAVGRSPWVVVDGRQGVIAPQGIEGLDSAKARALWINVALLALLLRGGLLVHAAGAVLKGCGLVFPAVSGTGKSTLSGLLEAEFPGSVVCDERIAVRPVATPDVAAPRWTLAGTPWASSAGIARMTAAPLAALVFLEQALECEITPISASDAVRRMLPLISVDWKNDALADRGVAALDALLAAVPAYVFRFPKSPAAARFIAAWAETLAGGCVKKVTVKSDFACVAYAGEGCAAALQLQPYRHPAPPASLPDFLFS